MILFQQDARLNLGFLRGDLHHRFNQKLIIDSLSKIA